jgi:hypothetical protein
MEYLRICVDMLLATNTSAVDATTADKKLDFYMNQHG